MCDDLLAKQLIDNLRRVGYPCEIALQRGFADVEKPTIAVTRIKVDGDTARRSRAPTRPTRSPHEDTIKLAKETASGRSSTLVVLSARRRTGRRTRRVHVVASEKTRDPALPCR
jgi:hypothetical protein